MENSHVLKDVKEKFDNFVKKPENYLKVQSNLADNVKTVVKKLYDYTKSVESTSSGDALPELIIQEFDEEQIWQQLELQNETVFSKFLGDVAYFTARKRRLQFPIAKTVFPLSPKATGSSENLRSICQNSEEYDDNKDRVSSDDQDVTRRENGDDFSSPEEEEEERKGAQNTRVRKASGKPKPSVVDDKFFKLGEMQEFLETEDRKENSLTGSSSRKRPGNDSDDDDEEDDDDSVDYFEDISPEDDSDEDSALNAKYKDFFDGPDSGEPTPDEIESDKQLKEGSTKRSVRFNLPSEVNVASNDSEQQSDIEMESMTTGADKSGFDIEDGVLSSLERRKARLDERVAKLEQQALSDKPWQLRGEVGAETRPHNSLLEEAVEFDSVSRPAPVRTEKTTMKLEDIIKQRIKDRAWDDVERKQKPVESPHEYRKRLILDQEKSKLSLAEVYEQEYLKQKEKTSNDTAVGQEKPEEEPTEHREIRSLITNLFSKLDALSNFHYTPKMIAPEVKVVTNLPAISVEEVAPAATSDATLLAPEEVKSKPRGGGDVVSSTEKTTTDRKRERRHKKMLQKKRAQRMVEKQKAAGVLVRGSNVSKLEDSGADRGIKSSTAFFNQLQDEVRGQVQRLSAAKRATGTTLNAISAKKLKL